MQGKGNFQMLLPSHAQFMFSNNLNFQISAELGTIIISHAALYLFHNMNQDDEITSVFDYQEFRGTHGLWKLSKQTLTVSTLDLFLWIQHLSHCTKY